MSDGNSPAPPRIAFDLTFADKSLTGTRVYAHQLQAALTALGSLELVVPSGPTIRAHPNGAGDLSSGARNLWWLQVGLPRELRRMRADVVHSLAFLGPLLAPCPMVVTVADISFLKFPSDFDYKWKLYSRFIGPTVRRSARVITVSEFSKSQIVAAYGVPDESVRVIYHGVSPDFHSGYEPHTIAAALDRYQLREDYILFVGEMEPRKNVVALVEMLAQLRCRPEFRNLQLALVGPGGSGLSAIRATVARTQLEPAVRELGYVPSKDLPLLYAGARVFVFPSLLEGFGLPLLEAMACGTPVVAANTSSIPEVTGDAAALVPVADTNALREAVARVLDSPDYANELRWRGIERAQQFSWARAARETAAVYLEAWSTTSSK